MAKRKRPVDYQLLAKKSGYLWLGPKVQRTSDKTKWQCQHGHIWLARFGDIARGRRCPECSAYPRRKTESDFHELGTRRGFKWIGSKAIPTKTPTHWECGAGHRWEATYANIRQGSNCPICSRSSRRKTPEEYRVLAKSRGYVWLGPEVASVAAKTNWECGFHHQWEARYSSIARGDGCPHCSHRAKKTGEDYAAVATDGEIEWIGHLPKNTQAKTLWKCQKGHSWTASYAMVSQGTGCPVCAIEASKRYRPRRSSADYNALAERRGFIWLGPEVATTHNLTRWVCKEGHIWKTSFKQINKGSGCPRCARVARKTKSDFQALAKARGFEWKGQSVTNTKTPAPWRCKLGHSWLAPYSRILAGGGCPICAGNCPLSEENFRAVAADRGYKWLSNRATAAHQPSRWECAEGHRWNATYSDIKGGRGCPRCSALAAAVPPAKYTELAESRGFDWMGPSADNSATKTEWRCGKGHTWEATYNSVSRGTGCPYCAVEAQRFTDRDYRKLAASRGFSWVGPRVTNTLVKTDWECDSGHTWSATYSDIRKGSGCPHCLDMVNGARVSKRQRQLAEMLCGELNSPFGDYRIDVFIERNSVPIAVEYDCWFWHAERLDADRQRDDEMIAAGLSVLRVLTNDQLPSSEQLDLAVGEILGGRRKAEILLDDWGKGPTRSDRLDRPNADNVPLKANESSG